MDKNINMLLQKFELNKERERNIKSTLEEQTTTSINNIRTAVENSPETNPPFKTYGYSPQPWLNDQVPN